MKKMPWLFTKTNESFALFVVFVFVVVCVLVFVFRFWFAFSIIVVDRFLIRHFLRIRLSDVHTNGSSMLEKELTMSETIGAEKKNKTKSALFLNLLMQRLKTEQTKPWKQMINNARWRLNTATYAYLWSGDQKTLPTNDMRSSKKNSVSFNDLTLNTSNQSHSWHQSQIQNKNILKWNTPSDPTCRQNTIHLQKQSKAMLLETFKHAEFDP